MTEQYLINHQLNKNVKIVPISEIKNKIKAWNCNDLPTDMQPDPDYLENLLRTVGNENVKIYSIDICAETDEEIKKENQVTKSKIRVISESAIKCIRKWADKRRNQEKCVKKKSVVKKIVDCCPWQIPWLVLTISLIQIAIYAWDDNNFLYRTFIFSPFKKQEIWRFLSYSLLHAGIVHLSLNVLIQLLISLPLETEQGRIRVLVIYFGGVLSGSLGASIFEDSLMLGASSGVYSLLMSHIPHIFMNFSSLSHRYFRIVCVTVLSLGDILFAIHHCIEKGNSEPRIHLVAHICGAISGITLGFIFYRNITTSKVIINRLLNILCLILFTCWLFVTVFYNIKHSSSS